MRPDTKLRLARRKHTLELLKWLYSRRDPQLEGTKLSLEHRHKQDGGIAQSRSLTYGEIDVPDFLSILHLVKPKNGEIFVDLGSGTGKAVLAASCGFPEFSECRGIELVQGLADAAVDHLQTAKAFLSGPRVPPDNTGPTSSTGVALALTGEGSTALGAGAPCATDKLGRGGAGGRKGKKTPCKAANQGLRAVDLEALIADLLSRQPSSPQALCVEEGETGGNGATAFGVREATAEEVASRLVRELGHRRYKSSLRGYGGLQKFLLSRRKASDKSSGLDIAEDGARVTVTPMHIAEDGAMVTMAPMQTVPPSVEGVSSLQQEDAVDDGRDQETTQSGVSVKQECSGDYLGAAAGAVTAGVAATVISEGHSPKVGQSESSVFETPPPPAACTPVPTVTSSVTPSLPSASCDEPRPSAFSTAIGGVCDGARASGGGSITNRRRLPEQGPLTFECLSGVKLVCGDIFQEPWDDAEVVYVASLLFDEAMMVLLAEGIRKLRKGARVISLRPIPVLETSGKIPGQSNIRVDGGGTGVQQDSRGGQATEEQRGSLRLLHEGVFRMSWQMARVYVYLRL